VEDSPLIRHPLQHSRFRGFVFTHNDAPQSVGLPWTSDQSLAETSTWQHTTLTPDKHPCPREGFEPTISHSFPFLVRLWWQHLVIEVFIYPSSSVIFWVILGGRLAPYQTSITAFSFSRFRVHTQRRATVGRTPLDEWSIPRRDLYLTTHNTHTRQTSMSPGVVRTHNLPQFPIFS